MDTEKDIDPETLLKLKGEIVRSTETIQKALVDHDLKLYPSILAMMVIIRAFEKDHPQVVGGFKHILDNPHPPETVH